MGLEVEGVGLVHKGFCFNQFQRLLDEEEAEETAHLSVAERAEFTAESYAADVKELRSIGQGSFGSAMLIELASTGERFVAKKIGLEHLAEEEQLKAKREI